MLNTLRQSIYVNPYVAAVADDFLVQYDERRLAFSNGYKIMSNTIIKVQKLKKYFPIKGGILNQTTAEVQAVDAINFAVSRGETLELVSGCGKSTTARLLIIEQDDGEIIFDGYAVGKRNGMMRKRMQMVFQDSYSSLNPRLPVESSIAFGPIVHGLYGSIF